jgi:hypothetical protein
VVVVGNVVHFAADDGATPAAQAAKEVDLSVDMTSLKWKERKRNYKIVKK